MGGAEFGARVCGGEELFGDGSEGGVVDGEVERYWGFVGCVEGPGGDEAWGVFGVDWYVCFRFPDDIFLDAGADLRNHYSHRPHRSRNPRRGHQYRCRSLRWCRMKQITFINVILNLSRAFHLTARGVALLAKALGEYQGQPKLARNPLCKLFLKGSLNAAANCTYV